MDGGEGVIIMSLIKMMTGTQFIQCIGYDAVITRLGGVIGRNYGCGQIVGHSSLWAYNWAYE